MKNKRASRVEIEAFEAKRAERVRKWKRLPTAYQEYARGTPIEEKQEEATWETNERENYGFLFPAHARSLVSPQEHIPLPSCFDGDPNLHLTGGTDHIRRQNIANKKKSIFYKTYLLSAREIAERMWQEGKRENTILKDRDYRQFVEDTKKPSHPLSLNNDTNHPLHNISLSKYASQAAHSYPSVFPQELRELLYVVHNVLHYLPNMPLTSEDIHTLSLAAGSSYHQIITYVVLARYQLLASDPPSDHAFYTRYFNHK